MKTTLDLPDDLLIEAKAVAARRLVDANHEHNAAATAYLKQVMASGWAT